MPTIKKQVDLTRTDPRGTGPAGGGAFEDRDHGRRTLVVDDNPDAADMMAIFLSESGYEVRTANDGETAIREARSFRPDLIFMDISLPGIDGHEACRRIRCEPWGGDMIIVALTGWGADEVRCRAQRSGFDRHVLKPVDPDALVRLARDASPPAV